MATSGTASEITIRELGREAADLTREVHFARKVVAAAEGLQDALAKLRGSDISWPTKSTLEAIRTARDTLADAIYNYRRVMLTVQYGDKRPEENNSHEA